MSQIQNNQSKKYFSHIFLTPKKKILLAGARIFYCYIRVNIVSFKLEMDDGLF